MNAVERERKAVRAAIEEARRKAITTADEERKAVRAAIEEARRKAITTADEGVMACAQVLATCAVAEALLLVSREMGNA